VADGDEHAADGQSRVELSRVSRRRTPVTPGLGSSPRISSTTAFVTSSMLRVAARALEHDPRRAELVAAVDDRDLGREPGQERRLLHRRVAAADHRQVAPLEQRAVAGRARGHAVLLELVCSDGMPSHFADAPVAMISVSAASSPSVDTTRNGRSPARPP
jgi:hypothetical protein